MGEPGDVRDRIEELIALSHIVKASDEDIEWLYPDRSEDAVLSSWRDAGAALVVLTKGAGGVIAFAGDHTVSRPTMATHVEDTIGAGDSFMAGLLVALQRRGFLGEGARKLAAIDGEDLEASIDFALQCAAITVSRVGANPPTQADLDTRG
jgi:fructokinase